MQEQLHFYYTNDLHSNFDHWPIVAGYLKEAKARKEAENKLCLLFDIGDHMDRFHPISEAFMGKANVELMNDVGYDVVTLGNNEGITLSHNDLYHLYDDANFQVVCANLKSLTDHTPNWLDPTVNIETVSGLTIGIIGLTAPFNAFYHLLDWHVDYAFETLDHHIKELKKSTDIIILLSHLGLNEDRQIANRYEEIDVIVGGHTHHLLRTEEVVNNTILTAAGKNCQFVGEVILTWDHTLKQLVKKEAYTTDITHLAKDLPTAQKLDEYHKKADQILGKPIVHIDRPIKVKWFESTEIMEELTHTLREWTKSDCAMLNAGLLLDELSAGTITYKDVHRICPHPVNPCVVELSGDELLEVIRASFTKELMELKLQGFGFRGEVIGRMIFSGLAIETAIHHNGHEYVKSVLLDDKKIDPNQSYVVATADIFTFGRLLPEVAKSTRKDYFLPEFLRDLLAYTLRNKFTICNE
jgi:2',3'-cyclic-nucleotide 2'-phosphodiesterase (5'-nucleotidase family)